MRRALAALLAVAAAVPHLAGAEQAAPAPSAPPPPAEAPAAAPAGPAAPRPDPSYLPELVAKARALRLAEDRGWLRLLHYGPRWFGGWKGDADGPKFWRAPDGQYDPAAELEATLAGFFDATPHADELDDAQCRFPARFTFLSRRLGIDPARLPRRSCPRFEDFYRRVSPRSVTLVFSSWYLNNPGSSFGHTLLRLNKAEQARGGKHFELLDYGVNYAADADTKNPILYAVKGLVGLFKGSLTHYAYYYKVREYGDYESRDLWEYDLDLSPEESSLLAEHLWELGGTWFDYWYLDENCASMMLAVLEAAAPRLHLLDHVGRFVVLPSDTVKALFATPGLVRAVHFRPSIKTQFDARIAKLDGRELDLVQALDADPGAPLPAALSPRQQADVLDAALDHVDLRFAEDLARGTAPAAAAVRQRLLVRRSALLVQGEPLEIPTPTERAPQLGHGSSRAGVAGGVSREDGPLLDVEARTALHDFGDPPAGLPDVAAIEFLPARLRWAPRARPGRRLQLDDFSVVRVATMNPVTRFDLRPSWRFGAGATTIRDRGCDGCLAGAADGGAGWAAVGLFRALDLVATLDLEVRASPRLSGLDGSAWRPGVGPSGLARLRLGDRLSLVATAAWRWLPLAAPEATWDLAGDLRVHVAHDLSLALRARRTPVDDEATLGALGYF